jgi:hypothetical protein
MRHGLRSCSPLLRACSHSYKYNVWSVHVVACPVCMTLHAVLSALFYTPLLHGALYVTEEQHPSML